MSPTLVFNSLVSKAKRGKDDVIYVGNMIRESEFSKYYRAYCRASVKCPFEKGLVSDFGNFEFMNDYILRNLGYNDHPIGGDLMYSESFCNLTSKREKTLELFFEAYGVQRILPLSEPLISMYQYQKPETPLDRFSVEYGMIVSVGYKYCLVIPIIGGKADLGHARRINVGTSDCFNLMSKSLTLKYEHLSLKMNFATLKVT